MKKMEYLSPERVELHYRIPLAEVVIDFFDQMKSRTQGYASLDYELAGYEASSLVKVDLLLNGVPADSRVATGGAMGREMLTDDRLDRVRALNEVAAARGQSLAQMALAWALRDGRMTSLVIGASSVRQLEDNLGALDGPPLTEAELAEIDRHAVEAGINLWKTSSEA